MSGSRRLWTLASAMAVLVPGALRAQAEPVPALIGAYFRAVGEYFRVPEAEVSILAEWSLPPEEIPVVLFLARRGGISTDALIAMKRGGRGWGELAERYGVDAGAFHVPLSAGADGGSLATAYEKFRDLPSGRWAEVRLDDREIVGLVNLRFLSEFLDEPPEGVLEAWARTGSFPAALRFLARR